MSLHPCRAEPTCPTFDRRQRMPFLASSPSSRCRQPQLHMHCGAFGLAGLCFTRGLHHRFQSLPCLFAASAFREAVHTPLVCHFVLYSHLCQDANHTFFSSAMGKSRSATVVIAYLMQEHNLSPSKALSNLRQARSICEPNEGFIKQLELYGEMQTPEDVEQTPAYQRWVYQREIELSRACGQAPEAEKIRFEDEHVDDQSSAFELRCRKCRCVVYLSSFPVVKFSCRLRLAQRLTIPQANTCDFTVLNRTQVGRNHQ